MLSLEVRPPDYSPTPETANFEFGDKNKDPILVPHVQFSVLASHRSIAGAPPNSPMRSFIYLSEEKERRRSIAVRPLGRNSVGMSVAFIFRESSRSARRERTLASARSEPILRK